MIKKVPQIEILCLQSEIPYQSIGDFYLQILIKLQKWFNDWCYRFDTFWCIIFSMVYDTRNRIDA